MKRMYSKPEMYAETFVANQYVAACTSPQYETTPTKVKCESKGHTNTQSITMFTDSQSACIAKFVPNVGTAVDDKFKTQFNACAYVDECNQQTWLAEHPYDTDFSSHAFWHGTPEGSRTGFINHDTTIDLSLAKKFNLS